MSLINEFSVQLYTLKDETKKDFIGTLERLAKIGYTGVEFAGYGEINADKMRKALDSNNLKSVGSHVGLDLLKSNLGMVLTYNAVIGSEYIIVPYAEMKTRDDALRLAGELNYFADKCVGEGFKFAYHNHAHEFAKDGGEYLLDIVYDNVDRTKVALELDLFWVAYAGVDPMVYIEKQKDVLKLLHLKQIRDMETKRDADLDEGLLDFGSLIKSALAYGTERFVLEQEGFDVSPFVSVEKGFKHVMSL